MKRIKALNGYTIYEYTKRDENDGHSAREYAIYFSCDIRDYGTTNSDPEFSDIDSLNVALELCNDNTARAMEIVSENYTCVEFSDVEKVKNALDAGADNETAEKVLLNENDENENGQNFEMYLNNTEWIDTEIIINGLESEFSFVWDNDYIFTEYGREKFKTILNGSYEINDGYINVNADGADENIIDYFNACIAGYISEKEYDKILIHK